MFSYETDRIDIVTIIELLDDLKNCGYWSNIEIQIENDSITANLQVIKDDTDIIDYNYNHIDMSTFKMSSMDICDILERLKTEDINKVKESVIWKI